MSATQAGTTREQDSAVHSPNSVTAVNAGPGSGKTRVLVHRISYLVSRRGLPPESIVALTFTVDAAEGLMERAQLLLGPMADDLNIGTIHKFCHGMLGRYGEAIGVQPGFSTYIGRPQWTVLDAALKWLNRSDVPNKREVSAAITRYKSGMYGGGGLYPPPWLLPVLDAYQSRLRQSNALDGDDLLTETRRLFDERLDVLAEASRHIQHLLIDEFQDTNAVQYDIVRMLAQAGSGLTVVGDPDQSIYGWRAADARNLQRFANDFPNAQHVMLGQSFRSTQRILTAARGVIAKDGTSTEREIWTDNPPGVPVKAFEFSTPDDEATFVAAEVQRLVANGGLNFGDCAVLFRTNGQSKALEHAFVERGLPVLVSGNDVFYDRPEIRGLLAYLRLLRNPSDEDAFCTAVMIPRRGIGPATVKDVATWAFREDMEIMAAARYAAGPAGRLRKPQATAMNEFIGLMDSFEVLLESASIGEVLQAINDETGYAKFVESSMGAAAASNIDRLFASAANHADLNGRDGLDLLLEEAALLADAAHGVEYASSAVALMTLHSAKGLEFPAVFMVGMEEGKLPHHRAIDESQRLMQAHVASGENVPLPDELGSLAEERRLCYVGMTRAESRLYLTWSSRRYDERRNEWRFTARSRFIDSIPPEVIRVINADALLAAAG